VTGIFLRRGACSCHEIKLGAAATQVQRAGGGAALAVAHLGFLCCSGCSALACLLSVYLQETLTRAAAKPIALRRLQPLSFVHFFGQSQGLRECNCRFPTSHRRWAGCLRRGTDAGRRSRRWNGRAACDVEGGWLEEATGAPVSPAAFRLGSAAGGEVDDGDAAGGATQAAHIGTDRASARVRARACFPSISFLCLPLYVAFASVLCFVPGREGAGSPMVAYVVPTATCSVRNNAPVKEVRKPNPVDSEIVLIVTRPVISHGMAGGALFAQWRGCVGSSMRRTG
jgi:hypothetical protein